MGFLVPDMQVPVVKATNCLIAHDDRLFPPKPPEMPCIRCGSCAEACPHGAITFGNTLDTDSAVSKLKRDPRNYSVLGFLDVRPRVTYLARIRNPNPAIVKLEGRKLEDGPDTLRDYERHRHENPFKEHGHPSGNDEKKHAAAEATVGKGAV